MKQLLVFLLSLLPFQALIAQVAFSSYYQDGAYVFDDEFKVMRSDLFTEYKSQFNLGSDDEMELQDETDVVLESGDIRTMARYVQKHKGYPVEGQMVNVVSKCDVVLRVNGLCLGGLNIDDGNVISEATALNNALNHIGQVVEYFWDNADLQDLLKDAEEDENATYYPEGELVIAKKQDESAVDEPVNYQLCWKFIINYLDTVEVDTNGIDTAIRTQFVYVDANTGSVFDSYNPELHGYHQTADQWTWYYGQRYDEMTTFKCSACFQFSLENRDRNIFTYQSSAPLFNKYRDADNNWVDVDKKTGAQAFWAVNIARDYYYNKLYVPFGSNVKKLMIYCNQSIGDEDLSGNSGPASFVPAGNKPYIRVSLDNQSGFTSGAALDVIGHEYTHFYISETCKLQSIGSGDGRESAALNEGFADILGMLAERWKWGWCDWSIGEQLGSNWSKNFHSPHVEPRPTASIVGGTNWNVRFPHGNAGPLRKWFTHMSQGEWNWPIPYGGIGLDKSELLVRDLITWNLWPSVHYSDVRNQSLHLAADQWGRCSREWNAVERAWYDVGVGGLSLCNFRFNPNTPVVVSKPIGGIMNEFSVVVKPNDPEDEFEEIDYDWIGIPTNWTFGYNQDESAITVTDIGDDYSSKMISVVVTYQLEGDVTVHNETLSFPIHFSDACSGAKPGRPSSVTAKKLSEVRVYPNPTDKYLVVEGVLSGTVLQLYNIMGQEVYKSVANKGIETINTTHFHPGVYILNLTDAQGNRATRRIVKQ